MLFATATSLTGQSNALADSAVLIAVHSFVLYITYSVSEDMATGSDTVSELEELAEMAFQINEEVENIGARRLHTILTTLLEDILFEVPDKIPSEKIEISKELVNKKLESIVKDRDLSKYIL